MGDEKELESMVCVHLLKYRPRREMHIYGILIIHAIGFFDID